MVGENKKAILIKESPNSIHFRCSCGKRVATIFFNSEGYLDSSSIDICPRCGAMVDEDDIPEEEINIVI